MLAEQYVLEMIAAQIIDNYSKSPYSSDAAMAETLKIMRHCKKEHPGEDFLQDPQIFMFRVLPLLANWPIVHTNMGSARVCACPAVSTSIRCASTMPSSSMNT